jgi:HEAT repeats
MRGQDDPAREVIAVLLGVVEQAASLEARVAAVKSLGEFVPHPDAVKALEQIARSDNMADVKAAATEVFAERRRRDSE